MLGESDARLLSDVYKSNDKFVKLKIFHKIYLEANVCLIDYLQRPNYSWHDCWSSVPKLEMTIWSCAQEKW